MVTEKQFDIFTNRSLVDPFPNYHNVRQNNPVCELESGGVWLISRYQDVKYALQEFDVFSSKDSVKILQPDWFNNDLFPKFMFEEDPPLYNIHRSVILRTFAGKVIDNLTPLTQQVAKSLVASLKTHTAPELLSDFSYPYFGKLTQLFTGIDNDCLQHARDLSVLLYEIPEAPCEDFSIRFQETFNSFRKNIIGILKFPDRPRNNLQILLKDAIKDKNLSLNEACEAMEMIVISTYTAPIHLMSHLYINLAKQAGVKATLKKDKKLIPAFIEETMRFNSSVHFVARKTRRKVKLSGTVIPADTPIYLMIAAANRDPEQFENPDSFDIHRDFHSHLGFGHGAHRCLGAKLIRVAGKIAIDELLSTFERIDCPEIDTLPWSYSSVSHHVERIPMNLE
jgi:cytochrome P450